MRSDYILINPKPFTIKRYLWILIGLACVIVGSVIFYFFEYKNIQALSYFTIALIACGWFSITYNVFPDLMNRSKRFDKKWGLKILTTIVMLCLIGINIDLITNLERQRESDILTNEPSIITTTRVDFIEMRKKTRGGGTNRYIHIKYRVNGNTISQEKLDNKNEFTVIKDYKLKYSVKYPEMFEIYK